MREFNLADMIRHLNPRIVVELGTGDGATAASMMKALSEDAMLVCINWPNPPSGDNPNLYLAVWCEDPRLTILYGDTRDAEVVARVPNGIDLLHIDSTHTAECARDEWRLYGPKLAEKAVVVVDDLDQNNMMEFWNSLTHHKETVYNGHIGIVNYRR